MRFSIAQEVLEKLLNYMASKPFNEVAILIQAAQQDIKPIVEKVKEEKSTPIAKSK